MEMPVEISGSVTKDFDLTEVARQLRAADEYANNGRSARTLAKAPEANVVLTVIAAHTTLGEHQAPGSVTLVVIEGRVGFVADGEERELAAGSAVAFAGGVRHSVRGIEDSAFLLVITRPRPSDDDD